MATKTKGGSYRMDLVLPEAEFLALEKLAEDAGLTVSQVIRAKLKGFELARRAA